MSKVRSAPIPVWTIAVLFIACHGVAVAAAPWIGGERPDQRPEAAPRVAEPQIDDALKQKRLRGISKPWPGNVETIAEQGNWWSPMLVPGMPGRYDLRALHQSTKPNSGESKVTR